MTPSSSRLTAGAEDRPRAALPASSACRLTADRLLFERYHDRGDPICRAQLVERFLPLARQLASRYVRRDEPFDDLLQVACLGLLNAIDRYDLRHGAAFSSYAVPTIVGELKRYFRDKTWAVRVPRDLQELALRVERLGGELARDLGRQPSVAELAAAAGAVEEDVLEALEAATAYRAASLDAPVHSEAEDDTLGASIGMTDDGYARAEQRALLDQLVRSVSLRERRVLRLRFDEDLTQQQIGERIGISQMQVSRILRASIARLRERATIQPPRTTPTSN
jgi:RNA polymerase sigma-B factor